MVQKHDHFTKSRPLLRRNQRDQQEKKPPADVTHASFAASGCSYSLYTLHTAPDTLARPKRRGIAFATASGSGLTLIACTDVFLCLWPAGVYFLWPAGFFHSNIFHYFFLSQSFFFLFKLWNLCNNTTWNCILVLLSEAWSAQWGLTKRERG